MKVLSDHPDFNVLVENTADGLGMLPSLVLKDYWVTRVLRAITHLERSTCHVIFKGGTSLSKGWGLIDRFSEDVDLLIAGTDSNKVPGKGERERIFKKIRTFIESNTPLKLPNLIKLPKSEAGFLYTRGSYHCNIRYPLPGMKVSPSSAFADYVLIEMGFRGSVHPRTTVPVDSYVAKFILKDDAMRRQLKEYEEDFLPFKMELLDPTRTFVEKLLAIHCAMEQGVEHVRTRHYYDLAMLYEKSEKVRAFLAKVEFPNLMREAIEISNQYFDTRLDPAKLDFAKNHALNPLPEEIVKLAANYASERDFYFRKQPTFESLMLTLDKIKATLYRSDVRRRA